MLKELTKKVNKPLKNLDFNNPVTLMQLLRNLPEFSQTTKQTVTFGCDPEFFFKSTNKDSTVVAAEKILPKEGLITVARPSYYTDSEWASYLSAHKNASKFVIDGVAAELNPNPNTCRALHANEISKCFRKLKETLKERKVKAALNQVMIDIPPDYLKELDEKNRRFGCAPSLNAYNSSAKINVDPNKYFKRGAGGHIHLGVYKYWTSNPKKYDIKDLVFLLDVLVGNTSVLIDRNPDNIERRKNYGRAGEYRLPPHGIEYRTLSNFWLTAYPLMSLVFGLARQAYEIFADNSECGKKILNAIKTAVSEKDVTNAINNNDFELALYNYSKLEYYIVSSSTDSDHHTITRSTVKYFLHFVEMINTHGLTYWFPEDPLDHWTSMKDGHDNGIYQFLLGTVASDLMKTKEKIRATKK